MRSCSGLLIITILICLKVSFGHEGHHEENNAIFSDTPTIVVSGVINVALIGFSGNGEESFQINPTLFQRHIESLYRMSQPSIGTTDEESYTRYFVRYRMNLADEFLGELESRITELLKVQLTITSNQAKEIIEIDAKRVEDIFEKVFRETYTREIDWENRYTIVLANPSFTRIKQNIIADVSPELQETVRQMQGYTWTFNGVPTNVWIGKGKWANIDITARGSFIGPALSDIGVRSPFSIPRLYEHPVNEEGRRITFEAGLASAIYSFVGYVVFPDTTFTPHTTTWDQVFVPVMIFKNHDQPVEFNMPLVYQELRRIFHKSLKLDIKFGTHNLHEHKHLSMAVSKSIQTQVGHELNEAGRYVMKTKPYIDPKTLGVELRRSADVLAGLLLDNSATIGLNKKVIPVYVFSLLGMDPDLLLEGSQLVHAEHDFVIVLHTGQESVSIPLLVGTKKATLDTRDPTRHIIAGMVLNQGVPAPYMHYSPLHKQMQYDYSWAIGHTPFGPFGQASEMSAFFIDAINRNAAQSRVQTGVNIIRSSLTKIDRFAERYLHGILKSGEESWTSWLEAAYHGAEPESNPILFTNTVDRLHSQLYDLNEQLRNVSSHLRSLKNDDAYRDSQSFLYAAEVFQTYALHELHVAEIRLVCCNIRHTPPTDVAFYSAIVLGLGMIAIFAPIIIVAGYFLYRTQINNPKAEARRKKLEAEKGILG